MTRPFQLLGALIVAPCLLLADFSYKQTTRMTGGALVQMSRALGGLSKGMRKIGEPQVSSVYVQGNRMAQISPTSGQIWDLDKETLTDIDFEKKTFSVVTFAQMREAMERAMQKASGQSSPKSENRNTGDPQTEMNFKMDIKETGKTQSLEGLPAREVLMTMIMEGKDKKSGQTGEVQTMSSIWVTDRVPGHDEYEAFQKKLGEKMAAQYANMAKMGPGMMMGMDPKMRDSMAKMAAEAEKLKGVHLRQVTKIGSNLDPAKAGEVTDPSTMPEGPTGGQVAGSAAGSAAESQASRVKLPGGLGSIGGLGGFGRRKNKEQQQPPAEQPSNTNAQQQSGVLMEMVMDMGQFSNAPIPGAPFAAPAGFQQVEHPMVKMGR